MVRAGSNGHLLETHLVVVYYLEASLSIAKLYYRGGPNGVIGSSSILLKNIG